MCWKNCTINFYFNLLSLMWIRNYALNILIFAKSYPRGTSECLRIFCEGNTFDNHPHLSRKYFL